MRAHSNRQPPAERVTPACAERVAEATCSSELRRKFPSRHLRQPLLSILRQALRDILTSRPSFCYITTDLRESPRNPSPTLGYSSEQSIEI